MWWEPEGEAESVLLEKIQRLAGLIREGRAAFVCGVGSFLDRPGRRVLLLVLDQPPPPWWLIPGPDFPYWYPREWELRSSEFLQRMGNLLGEPRFGRLRNYRFPNPMPFHCGPWLAEALSTFLKVGIPPDSRVLISGDIHRAAKRSELSLGGKETATLGSIMSIDDSLFATTAGHFAAGSNQVIDQVHHKFLGIRLGVRSLGRVTWTNDPTNVGGADLALIEAKLSPLRPVGIAPLNSPDRVVCELDGSLSGKRSGWKAGALALIEGDGRFWTNSWYIIGDQNGFAQKGDSGAPVIVKESGALLGHLVGVGGFLCKNGRRQAGFVQAIQFQIDEACKGLGRGSSTLAKCFL